MILNIKNHPFHYEMEKLTRIFLPDSELKVTDGCDESSDFITTERIKGENSDTVCVSVSAGGYYDKKNAKVEKCENFEAACERKMAVLLYDVLCSFTSYTPPWGILTGVRPAKLMNMLIDKTSENEAVSTFINELEVTSEKTSLALSVAKKERPIIEKSKPDSFSLYVSIPFCPTRCSYCSFVSQANEQAKRLIPQYVEKLCEEIRITGREIKKLGLVLESVYWGGGTPTTLSASQYEKISSAIAESFDLSTSEEYTVEAGRPDSVTREKLEAIKKSGATRISINPQTFNDSVLEVIGRKHTSAQTQAAMLLAKEYGAKTLAIVNAKGSSIAREADMLIYTHAGPEIAVASTKAYMVQIAVMYLFAFQFALAKGRITEDECKDLLSSLMEVPNKVEETLEKVVDDCQYAGSSLVNADSLLYIGRGLDYALSMEGSLKLKEISYIHSESYAAGELKHGTISLITEGMPVIAVATQNALFEKTLSNVKEVRSRGAYVILVCDEECHIGSDVADQIIRVPKIREELMPMLAIVPLQLIAYYTSLHRGNDIDKPRNLAKSVTVE